MSSVWHRPENSFQPCSVPPDGREGLDGLEGVEGLDGLDPEDPDPEEIPFVLDWLPLQVFLQERHLCLQSQPGPIDWLNPFAK